MNSGPSTRPAGAFSEWLDSMQAVLRGQRDADVPCDGCVGCCVSSYQIPLRPADKVALARVPDRYLRWPMGGGTVRMDHREDGTCPMLEAGRCSIYADRPRTCRDYDCRLYAAAELLPDGHRPVIQERVREWRFDYEDDAARARAAGLRRAAAFIRANQRHFPEGMRAHSATAAAVLAVKVHALFMDAGAQVPVERRVLEVIEAARAFDAATT